jgi:hypothetical protein
MVTKPKAAHLLPQDMPFVGSFDETTASYERVRPEFAALPAGELGRITINVPVAATIALGALPNLAALRAEMVRKLPEHDIGQIDKLPDYIYALIHAHVMTLPSADASSRLQALVDEGSPLRERMLGVAEALVAFGLVDAERVASIRSGTGHLDMAQDLVALSKLFRERWGELEGKTPLTPSDVERAGELGLALHGAIGRRRVGTDGSAAAGEYEEARLRAFRLFVRAYDQARRAVSYLRWNEGDVEALVPSIYRVRRRRAGASTGSGGPTEPVEPSEPAEPVDPDAAGPQ